MNTEKHSQGKLIGELILRERKNYFPATYHKNVPSKPLPTTIQKTMTLDSVLSNRI